MFRISYNSDISCKWRGRTELPVKKRRIYRWGIHWGILDNQWICEKRIVLESSDSMIVEQCMQSTELPPKDVDDIWEEEYCSMKGLEYNGLVFLKGTREEVLEIAKSQGLPIPGLSGLPVLHAPSTPVTNARVTHTRAYDKYDKRKCLIQD
jgi:hypothetical protein